MKKHYIFLTALLIISIFLISCKNVKIEDDYYYTETADIDGWKITLKGNGYGLYGQMIEKYKSGSIEELMNGSPMTIETSSADDNNSSYNEIYLTFEKDVYVKSFETDVSILKEEGLSQIRVSCKDEMDNETTLYSSYPFNGKIIVDKNVKSITLYIRGLKFYPTSYNYLTYKGKLKENNYEEIKGQQINNEITINYIKIEE